MSRLLSLLAAPLNRDHDPIRRFQYSLGAMAFLILCGTLGYIVIEDMTPIDAMYMTVITVATVGYGEVQELTPEGRAFTMLFIMLGVGVTTVAVSNAFSIFLGPLFWTSLEKRRMNQRLHQLKNHYIVCGYGRMGRQIVADLRARGEPFVVIDSNETIADELLEQGIPYLIGDATADEIMLEAEVERAKGLVAALSNDAGNVMTVLTAHELNPKLYIVARAVRHESESKLRRAGANEVINPYQIGGHRMALSLLRPAVNDFLSHIFHFGDNLNIEVGQVTVQEGSHLAGQTVATCDLRRVHNLTILGIKHANGKMVISPNPHTELEAGSTLIVIGEPDNVYDLEKANMEDDVS